MKETPLLVEMLAKGSMDRYGMGGRRGWHYKYKCTEAKRTCCQASTFPTEHRLEAIGKQISIEN
jgi:hypothetical protein